MTEPKTATEFANTILAKDIDRAESTADLASAHLEWLHNAAIHPGRPDISQSA